MRRMDREDQLLWATMFTFFAGGAGSQALGSLIPFFRDAYGLRYELAGMMVSLQSAGNLAAIVLTGFLPAVLGRRRTALVTAVWMAAAYLIFSSGLGGAAALLPASLMIGIAKGGNSNFANTMTSTLSGSRASAAYNLVHGAYAVGALLAPVLVVACASGGPAAWRIACVVLLALCVLQLTAYMKMPLPAEAPERRRQPADLSFLKNRRFWLASGIVFFYAATEYAINGWLVTYFRDSGVLGADAAQLMSSLFWLVMFAGRMLGAWIAGRISRSRLLMADGVGLLACFLLVLAGRSEPVIVWGISGVGLFMATVYTSALALGTEGIRGNALGINAMVLIGSVGGVIAPALVGFAAEWAGIRTGMYVVAGTIILLLAAIAAAVSQKEDPVR